MAYRSEQKYFMEELHKISERQSNYCAGLSTVSDRTALNIFLKDENPHDATNYIYEVHEFIEAIGDLSTKLYKHIKLLRNIFITGCPFQKVIRSYTYYLDTFCDATSVALEKLVSTMQITERDTLQTVAHSSGTLYSMPSIYLVQITREYNVVKEQLEEIRQDVTHIRRDEDLEDHTLKLILTRVAFYNKNLIKFITSLLEIM